MYIPTKRLSVYLACLALLIFAAACSGDSSGSVDPAGFGLASTPAGGVSFYVPMDPPSASYTVDATSSIDGSEIPIEGHVSIELTNTTDRSISVIALRWSSDPKNAATVSVGGDILEKHTELTREIIAACYEVHNVLGPGLEERFANKNSPSRTKKNIWVYIG